MVGLPQCCDRSGAKFTIEHVLLCKKDGLVVGRHNNIKAETGGIVIQALGSNRVCNEPKIMTCRKAPDAQMPRSAQTPLPSRVESDPPLPTLIHHSTFFPIPWAIF